MHVPPSSQRLFQYGTGSFILLNRQGLCVVFRRETDDSISILDRQRDLDFKASGSALIRDGWRCVGPGLEFAWLFDHAFSRPPQNGDPAGEDLGKKSERRELPHVHLQDPSHRSGDKSF